MSTTMEFAFVPGFIANVAASSGSPGLVEIVVNRVGVYRSPDELPMPGESGLTANCVCTGDAEQRRKFATRIINAFPVPAYQELVPLLAGMHTHELEEVHDAIVTNRSVRLDRIASHRVPTLATLISQYGTDPASVVANQGGRYVSPDSLPLPIEDYSLTGNSYLDDAASGASSEAGRFQAMESERQKRDRLMASILTNFPSVVQGRVKTALMQMDTAALQGMATALAAS